MSPSTAELLLDLHQQQEESIRAVKIHLCLGSDLSPKELDMVLEIERRLEETQAYLERSIHDTSESDGMLKTG